MIVTRFAPSPTGYLHLGHAFSAVNAWRRARANAGRFILRLEDIDPHRCRPEYATAILEDLAWLGLDWDPSNADTPISDASNGDTPDSDADGDAPNSDPCVRVQSRHLADYQTVLDDLSERGLLYPCFCTRADIVREVSASVAAPHGPDGAPLYPGTCRRLSAAERSDRIAAGQRFALRLDIQAACRPGLEYQEEGQGRVQCHPERFGDVVLARKDAPASYHLCVTHDDALQGVTLVTRGQDLRPATDLHRLLQALMGWPAPVYAHHRLLLDPSGRRLAKRGNAVTLRSLRAEGKTARAILELVDQS